jgi:N6-L-threonylcarbamoyladenine synthase
VIVLGVETSCDETGIALVSDGKDVLAEQLASQEEIHAPYAGVVPELASRQHIKLLGPLFQSALAESGCALHQIGLVGVTKGPGLVGCLLTGVSFAKGIAYGLGVPVLGINHIEAHIHSCFLDGVVDYPALALVISGGHTLLALIEAWGKYRRIGHTLDDAAGEAYDKVASKLGLAFPGGPAIEARARRGRAALKRSKTGRQGPRFPRPLLKSENFDFSFSGLKTAVLYWLKSRGTAPLGEDVVDMVAAAFEDAVIEVLLKKTLGAATHFGTRTILLAGGVAQNESLRTAFRKEVQSVGMRLVCPAKKYCGDNAVMVAALAYCRYAAGERDDWSLDVAPGLRLC